MTAAVRASAYPKSVDDLLPDALTLAERLGETPTRNRLMTELKIGAPKASALLDRLADVGVNDERDATSPADEANEQLRAHVDPPQQAIKRVSAWPVYLLALPAFIAVWSGWVGLGELTGFGVVHPLPGIWDSLSLNTAITLPIGVETYAAFALRAWLVGPVKVRRFAKWSAVGSLLLGASGQVAYHLLDAAGITSAPWPITTAVSCLPVAVLGMGASLAHLLHVDKES